MCSRRFSMLDRIFSPEEASILGKYFSSLTGNANNSITVTKASIAMGIAPEHAMALLIACHKNDILKICYAIRCPQCNTLIKRNPSCAGLPEGNLYCYACENEFEVTPENIELIFSLEVPDFFPEGQQDISRLESPVAPHNSLRYFMESGGNYNKLFFDPTEDNYSTWKALYENVFKKHKTTKAAGDALEAFVKSLFSAIQCVRCSDIKTTTNQIDCYIRNGFASQLSFLGDHIIIECKNEKKAPGNTYLLKIGGIISTINGKSGDHVKLGIIVSRVKAAQTVGDLAYTRYLSDNVTIITLCMDEISEVIFRKSNLLVLIEAKVDALKLQATTNLRASGLYG
jgi:hypothetical protein